MKPELIQDNPLANRVYNHYRRRLEEAGKWKDEYAPQFSVLVMAYVEWLELRERLKGVDVVLTSPKGNMYRNPLWDREAALVSTIQRFGAAFGLNPLADARLKAAPAGGIGALFNMLKGPDDGD